MRRIGRYLTRYWGYIALAVAVIGYFMHSLAVFLVLALSLAALGYFLLQAPMWCGAETRAGDWCRRNSHGLLRGCSLRQHKWQRLQQTFTPAGGRAILKTSKSAAGALGLFSGAVAGVQLLIAAGTLISR